MHKEFVIEGSFLIEKFKGKGGWHHIVLPEIKLSGKKSFGFVKISGLVDDFILNSINIMPMGNKKHMLPINASIRKFIKKGEGDYVILKLKLESNNTIMSENDFILCLKDEPIAFEKYLTLSKKEKEEQIAFVFEFEKIDIVTERIINTINNLKIP